MIKIELDHKYSFKEPNVITGTTLNHNMLSISDTFIINILNSIYNLDCLCCKSIICPNNRKPVKTVLNILDEIKTNNTIVIVLFVKKYHN